MEAHVPDNPGTINQVGGAGGAHRSSAVVEEGGRAGRSADPALTRAEAKPIVVAARITMRKGCEANVSRFATGPLLVSADGTLGGSSRPCRAPEMNATDSRLRLWYFHSPCGGLARTGAPKPDRAAGNRPEGTRHRHGKEPARRSCLFDSGRSEGVKEEGRCRREPPGSVRCMQYRISGTPRVTPCTQRTAPNWASADCLPWDVSCVLLESSSNRPRIVLESSSNPSRSRTG